MTYEEAIKELRGNYVLTNGTVKGKPLFESIGVAIEALEKQIPKKPINWLGKMLICPRCNRADYIKSLESYCKFCGQAIDWSEEE